MSEWDAVKTEPAKGSEWDVVDEPSPIGRGAGAFGESFGGSAKGMLATVGGLTPFLPPKYALQSLADIGESILPWLGNPTPYGGNTALNVVHGLPFIGPAAAQVVSEVGEGKYPEAAGHAGGNIAAMLLAGRLGTPRRGSAAVPAPEPATAYVPPYTGTRPGTVVGPEIPVASTASRYGPLMQRLGNAAVGVLSPRAKHSIEMGKAAYDIWKEVAGKTEPAAAAAPKPLPPPPVPEMNTGGPPIAKYTVSSTASRTPYLANVPKRTAPTAPADLPPPPIASTAGEGQKYFSSTLHGDIHGLGQQVYGRTGLHQKLHDVAVERYKVDSLKKLSDAQRMDFVDYLKAELEKQLNH